MNISINSTSFRSNQNNPSPKSQHPQPKKRKLQRLKHQLTNINTLAIKKMKKRNKLSQPREVPEAAETRDKPRNNPRSQEAI
jgi:hypothetical protein